MALSPLLMSGHAQELGRRTVERLFACALERGIDLFDPGLVTPASAQCLIASATASWSTKPFVVTRVGIRRLAASVFRCDASPATLVRECEDALRRLKGDALDLALLDGGDMHVDLEESVAALDTLKRAGKIREIGLSHVTRDELDRAQATTRIAAVECVFDPITRIHQPILERCDATGMIFFPRMPFDLGELVSPSSALRRVAIEHNATPRQIALAWLLHLSPRVTVIADAHHASDIARLARVRRIRLPRLDLDELSDETSCR